MLKKVFLDHPRTIGESYWEHLYQASCFSGKMFLGALACFIHGLVPSLFVKTGSNTITHLHECMVEKRNLQTRRNASPGTAPAAE